MSEIRRTNLYKLSLDFKRQAEFANKIELSPAYLNHILTGHRNIGEKTARKIEDKLKIPFLSLDTDKVELKTNGIKEEKKIYLTPKPIIDEESWRELPPKTRALIEDLLNKSKSGRLTDDKIKAIQNIVDIL